MKTHILRIFFVITAFFLFSQNVDAATYYLDAVNGDDVSGDGSATSPWQSFDKSKEMALPGDLFIMREGDYGSYEESDKSRSAYVTYRGEEGHDVHIDNINIDNTALYDVYLKFENVNIMPDWVDPCLGARVGCDDPQYELADQSTYTKTSFPVFVDRARYLQIIDSTIKGQDKNLTSAAVYMYSAEEILIKNCDIGTTSHGLRFITTGKNINVMYNHIHNICGTGINTLGKDYENLLYEGNYIHDGHCSPTEDYYPRAPGKNYHGSGISIRDGHVTVRGNIIHDMGSSAGMMFYADDVGNDYVNEDILIENNLFYDIGNVYVLRIYELGPNVVVRNNTFISNFREEASGYYKYHTALSFASMDEQNGPASLDIYNNIFVGAVMLLDGTKVRDSNNITWSYRVDGTWKCSNDEGVGSDTHIYTCSYLYTPSEELPKLFDEEQNLNFNKGHAQVLGFGFSKDSIAYNFGSPEQQPSVSLGSLSGNFIKNDGQLRNENFHSAGAYEHKEIHLFYGDVDASGMIDTIDASLVLRKSLGLSMSETNWQTSSATGDVNCDSSATTSDAMLLLRYSLGLEMSGTLWCE